MPELHILGAVGKSSTRTMVEAILHGAVKHTPVPVVVALGGAGGEPPAEFAEGCVLVATADALPVLPAGSPASVISFGLTDRADFRASDLVATLDGTAFTLYADGQAHPVVIRVLGEHQVVNALAAIAVGRAYGVPLEHAITALGNLRSIGPGRMELVRRDDDVLIIDDTVSASPQSTAAALKTLALVVGARRSVAVLGELSLGAEDDHRGEHDRIGRLIVRLNVRKLVVVGHDARHIHNAAGLEGSWDGESVLTQTAQEAYDLLRDELRAGDVVLVKSSAGGLGGLARRLTGVAP